MKVDSTKTEVTLQKEDAIVVAAILLARRGGLMFACPQDAAKCKDAKNNHHNNRCRVASRPLGVFQSRKKRH